MPNTNKLAFLLDKLIEDGKRLLEGAVSRDILRGFGGGSLREIHDLEALRKWANELRLFNSLAGDLVEPWKDNLIHDGRVILASHVETPLSALTTVKFAITEGLLTRFEDLIIAETFADLTEQAKYLLSQGYYLAAGVILRAVLEEKLRSLSLRNSCTPNRANPTLGDFNQALYTTSPPVYDKTMMQHVTALAGVGNKAAHNDQSLTEEEVQRLARDVPEFLAKFSP